MHESNFHLLTLAPCTQNGNVRPYVQPKKKRREVVCQAGC